ncbi:Cupredoxin [Delphinella strobiligena]|nr:Cupredoxin [Delphinella strobiligena]
MLTTLFTDRPRGLYSTFILHSSSYCSTLVKFNNKHSDKKFFLEHDDDEGGDHRYYNTSSLCPCYIGLSSDMCPCDYRSPAWLPVGQTSLEPNLSQSRTNGGSLWGTLIASTIGPWLDTPGQPMPSGTPWGGATSSNTNYYTDPPNTGVTRYYSFTISQGVIAPDGVEKQALLISGQFPGPLIEANWGDWIQVTLTNALPDEGTSLHWHGLLQKATPWMNGVPGVQQCPIAPPSTFTYRFQADLYGTSWYHSHYSAQYAGGLIGPMVIRGPVNAEYDVDLGPAMLSDWYHDDYFSLVEQVMAPVSENLPPPFSNNNLINGKANYPCSNTTLTCTPNAGISKFKFESGKKYRLRLINAGAEGIQKFSIDNHKMTVIANDFVEVQPYETDLITLGIGQRSDVIVEATGSSSDAVCMRSLIPAACSLPDGIAPQAVAAIYYQDASNSSLPNTTSSIAQSDLDYCGDDALSETQPVYSITPDPNPSFVQNVVISLQANNTGNDAETWDLWHINNSTFRIDYNDPDFGNNKTVQIVLINTFPTSHPMHLHGHNMYVLAEGYGEWDGVVTNPSNPQRRDVQLLHAAQADGTVAYAVIQVDMDNPGIWPIHCHIAWHVSAGLYFQILENPQSIQSDTAIPGIMAQTCRDWTSWTGDHMPDQIDSGL